ncbi:uncharacterized protein LOC121872363 [Homarus americanus]|nr:uncharacterized protein LOC121872363 [Homarus americanus]
MITNNTLDDYTVLASYPEEENLEEENETTPETGVRSSNILDNHGFLISHPEEERLDEEDDVKIYKAVVDSMAQWELQKIKKMNRRRLRRDEEVVCYMDLGCFRDEGPFDYLDMLPSPPEEVNTKFLLYTRERGEREKVIKPNNITTIINSHFNISRPTKLLIHGFGSSCYSVWIREMRVALLTMMNVNIICVNWQKGAEVPNYVRAASNTRLVGRQVALFIETLNAYLNTSLDDFHLIGFSLGAHVSGHAGARLKNLSRISGLDPAGPLFESYSPSVRLDHTDARFVDVIHTNADSLLMGGLGAFEPMGHVDFYPNGGRMQTGCANLFVGGVSDILWPTEGDGRYLCNHRRGYKYYLNSVAPICKFPAFICRDYETFLKGDCFPCDSCGNMGYFANQAEGRGQLYLITRDTEPFCANQYKVTVNHSGGPPAEPVTTYGRLDVTFIAADGINETLQLTQSEDTVLEAGKTTVRILVPHPALTEVHAVQLRYTAYNGWIYTGFSRWAIDKISLMDSFGNMLSFCHRGTTLISGKAMHLTLLPGDCVVRDAPLNPALTPHRFSDSLPEESENEVQQLSPVLAVAPRPEPQRNTTVSHHPFNLTQPIPTPILTPLDAHTTILTPLHGQVPLPINREVLPNYSRPQGFYNMSLLRPPHPPQVILPDKLSINLPDKMQNKVPLTRYGVAGGGVLTPPIPLSGTQASVVAVSSEEPVNVIPAPNLAHFPTQGSQIVFHPENEQGSGGVHPSGSKESSNSVNAPVFLHNTTPIPSPAGHNQTMNHPIVVSKAETGLTNKGSPPSMVVTPSLASALLPPDIHIINATIQTNKNAEDRTFSTRVSSVTPNTDASHASNSFKTTVKNNKTDPIISSTLSPEGPSLPSVSTPQTHKSGPILLGTLTPTPPSAAARPTLSIAPTGRPFWLAPNEQFSYHRRDNVGSASPVQVGRPITVYEFSPPAASPHQLHIQTELNNKAPAILDTNSLIDGEVPERERARALKLGPRPTNSINPQHFSAGNSRIDCDSSSLCSSQSDNRQSSHTSYTNIPSQVTSSQKNLTHRQPTVHQSPLQGSPPSRVDTPPRPHVRYISTHIEDSQLVGTETVLRPVETPPLLFVAPNGPLIRHPRPTPQARPLTVHDTQVRPSASHAQSPGAFLDNPLRPPPLRSLPPDTIVGRGRAPQPTQTSHDQDSWLPQTHHDLERVKTRGQKSSPVQQKAESHSQHQQLQQHHQQHLTQQQQQHLTQQQHYLTQQHQQQHLTQKHFTQQQQHQQHFMQHHQQQNQPRNHHHLEQQQHHTRAQQPSGQQSASASVSNVTQIKFEATPERPPRPVPAPVPLYVQLLPPAFSHLPHLETFSQPRESRKPQEPSSRKRGTVGGRASRGRSLSLPAPGGRAAVFTPLLLQVQENHQGRYIPLRHIPQAPLLT